MKAKKIASIMCFIISVLSICLLTACNNNRTSNKQEVTISLGGEPNSLDPAISLTIDVRSYLSGLFEGLLNIDDQGILIEGVASSFDGNEDSTEFIFHLRNNAFWTDGIAVNAEDFKYAWLRVLSPETASGWASFLYYIKNGKAYNSGECGAEEVGIEIIDDTTIKVIMEQSCSFFPSMTALQPYFPVREDIIGLHGNSWANNTSTYVTNGAYKIQAWQHNNKIELVKNDKYWDKINVHINKINFILSTDASMIMNAYETQEINFVSNTLKATEMQQIGTMNFADFVTTKFLAFNTRNANLSELNVRKALSIVLDRNNIASSFGIDCESLMSFIPKGFVNEIEDIDFRNDSKAITYLQATSNLSEAQILITDAGYSSSNQLVLEYLTNTSSANITLAEIIKYQLEQLNGVKVNINIYEPAVFNSYRANREFDIVAASWAAEYLDITSYLYGFVSTDYNNYSGFNNAEFDLVFSDILSINNKSQRYELCHTAEDSVMNSYCIAPLYSQKRTYIADKDLRDFYFDATGCLILRNINWT